MPIPMMIDDDLVGVQRCVTRKWPIFSSEIQDVQQFLEKFQNVLDL